MLSRTGHGVGIVVDSEAEDEKDVNIQELLPHPLAGKSMRRCTSSNALEYAVVG